MNNDNIPQISRAGFWRNLAIMTAVGLVTVLLVKPALIEYYDLFYVAELVQ